MDHEYLKELRLESAERVAQRCYDDAREEAEGARLEDMLRADATISLPELWFELADQLNIDPSQAADLIRRAAQTEGRATLYALNRYGFYSALQEPRDEPGRYWFDPFEAGQSAEWSRDWCVENLDFLRLSAQEAESVRVAAGMPQGAHSQAHTPNYLNPRHPRYAPKLAAAVRAWMAVDNQDGKTPKQVLMKWLRDHAEEFELLAAEGKPNELGIEECAKVANWQPTGGSPKTPGQ